MGFNFTESVADQLANVQGTPNFLSRNTTGGLVSWWQSAASVWLINFSREAGMDSSDAAITTYLRDVVGMTLSTDYMRIAINARGNTVSAHFLQQRTTIQTALGARPQFAIYLYTAAIASPAGNWGAVGFFFTAAAITELLSFTTAAQLPIPTNGSTTATRQMLTAVGAPGDASFYTALVRASGVEEPVDEEEPDVPEVVEPPPAVVEPPGEEMTIGGGPVNSMVSPIIINPGGAGGGTPTVGGASVSLVPIQGAGTLARFIVTLPGFARTATGFSFTNNAVARAAWTVTKAALAGLGLTQLVDLIDELADDASLLFRLGGGGTDYSVGDMIGNASVTKVWEANDVPFIALSDGRLGARKGTGMWRFWRPRRPIVLYSDGAKDLKTGIRAGKALIKQAREMRKLSNALLGTQKEKRKSPMPHHHLEPGTSIRNIEVT